MCTRRKVSSRTNTNREYPVTNKDEIREKNDERKLTKLRKFEGSAIGNELTVKALPSILLNP